MALEPVEIRNHAAEAVDADTRIRLLGSKIVAMQAADGPNWSAGDRGKAGVSAAFFGDFMQHLEADEVTEMTYNWLDIPPVVPVRTEETRDHRADALKCEFFCDALATKIVDAEASRRGPWSAGVIDTRFIGRFMEHAESDKVTGLGYLWLGVWIDSDPDFVPDPELP